MKAVVVYESMSGNTRLVAEAIGAGLKTAADVCVIPVPQASPAVLADADLVVAGGPTHAHGMSRAATRKAAAQAAEKPVNGVTLEPGALGAGLREWFGSLGRYEAKAAAFDTRMHGPAALTGRASKGAAPAAARARLPADRGAGELPGHQARAARATRSHPGTRVGNHAGRGHHAAASTRRTQLNQAPMRASRAAQRFTAADARHPSLTRGGNAVITARTAIDRPEQVFDYASDPANETEWNIRLDRLES